MNTIYIVRTKNGVRGFEDFVEAYESGLSEKIVPIPLLVTEDGNLVSRSELI